MRLRFGPKAARDLEWFTRYYADVFPDGRRNARQSLKATLDLVMANPMAGRATSCAGVRQFPVARTPFIIVYSVADDTLEVIRVWDGRADAVTW